MILSCFVEDVFDIICQLVWCLRFGYFIQGIEPLTDFYLVFRRNGCYIISDYRSFTPDLLEFDGNFCAHQFINQSFFISFHSILYTYAFIGMCRDSLRRIPPIGLLLSKSEGLVHAEGALTRFMVASGGVQSEGGGHGGPGICLGDGQTEAKGVLSQGG